MLGHISPECNMPINKIQDVVNNYEKLIADEKANVPDTKYAFAKQFVPECLEYCSPNGVKGAQPKNE